MKRTVVIYRCENEIHELMETYWGFYDAQNPEPGIDDKNYPICELCGNKLVREYDYEQEKKK